MFSKRAILSVYKSAEFLGLDLDNLDRLRWSLWVWKLAGEEMGSWLVREGGLRYLVLPGSACANFGFGEENLKRIFRNMFKFWVGVTYWYNALDVADNTLFSWIIS